MTETVVLIDYGLGNLGSLKNAVRKSGVDVSLIVSSDPAVVTAADKLVLPGVGHFGRGMQNLESRGLDGAIVQSVNRGVSLLGICLGMQLLADWGDEGACRGLGIIGGNVRRFDFPPESALRIPHMGWNSVHFRSDTWLSAGLEGLARFYFVHSYHFCSTDPASESGWTTYGYTFPSCIQSGNVVGVQFHPEKSHLFGLQLIRNFLTARCPQ